MKLPLRIHLAIAFSSIVLVVGGLIAVLGYQRTSAVLADSTRAWADSIGGRLGADFAHREARTRALFHVLAQHPGIAAATLEDRLGSIPALAAALDTMPGVVAIYTGNRAGDYFLLRRLVEAADYQVFSAPDSARYVVQSIEREGRVGRSIYVYLDAAFRELARRPRPQALDFDPRQRPWYRDAQERAGIVVTAPYRFFTSGRMGSSMALRLPAAGTTLGIDLRLDDFAETLRGLRPTRGARLALFDGDGNLLAIDDPAHAYGADEPIPEPFTALLPVRARAGGGEPRDLSIRGGRWQGSLLPVVVEPGHAIYLALLIPDAEILGHARALIRDQAILVMILLLAGLTAGIWFSRGLSGPLTRLAEDAKAVHRFDFDRASEVDSSILEVDALSASLAQMRVTVGRFLDIIAEVSAEEDLDRLLNGLLRRVVETAKAQAGVIYLHDAARGRLVPAAGRAADGVVSAELLPEHSRGDDTLGLDRAFAARAPQARRHGAGDLGAFAALRVLPDPVHSLAIPLLNRRGARVGALVLFGDTGFELARTRFIQRLSGFASVSLENRELIQAQRALFDAFVQLIAGAIDAKSPYTGGHCERVPELVCMLAEAACASSEGPFAGFGLSEREWEAVRLAAWLHDCGKVTTPEFVVDKATRLETLNDRLHEVRTRFEVLKREREVACWQAVAEGAERDTELASLAAEWQRLDDDFAFVAECNSGETYMSEERRARLRGIAARTWTRTLDDRLGLGREELERRSAASATALPVREPLLADRPDHRIPHKVPPAYPEALGISLAAPDILYDRGEVTNLCIARGTLTDEERYKINEHIIHTLAMLSRLPFPAHLAQVPELAGGHHERMDGRGYPRGQRGEDMSPVARMLAIADVYEALTASDRPYKPAKGMEQALAIMDRMAAEGHIDPELYLLFRQANIPQRYAEMHGEGC